MDVYRVFLQAGQTVTLDVVEASQASELRAELEMSVVDVAASIPIKETNGKIQSAQVDADAEYFITVSAVEGASKYVLTLGAVTPESLLQSIPSISNESATANDTLGTPIVIETPESSR